MYGPVAGLVAAGSPAFDWPAFEQLEHFPAAAFVAVDYIHWCHSSPAVSGSERIACSVELVVVAAPATVAGDGLVAVDEVPGTLVAVLILTFAAAVGSDPFDKTAVAAAVASSDAGTASSEPADSAVQGPVVGTAAAVVVGSQRSVAVVALIAADAA